jgi:Zn-dependent protease with chaperone function
MYYRFNEYRADEFAFTKGKGNDLKNALLTNYASNSEALFIDGFHSFL